MPKQIDDLVVYRIAKDYYINEMAQEEIAAAENISRSQVSRILKKAKERGFVEVSVRMPKSQKVEELQKQLQKKYKLQDVVISQTFSSEAKNLKNGQWSVYDAAAEYLSEELTKYRKIGIGWGSTVYEAAKLLPQVGGCESMQIYPLVANLGQDITNFQINVIVNRFSEKFSGAKPYYLNRPLYISNELKTAPWYQEWESIWKDLDVAVVGIGGIQSSNIIMYYDDKRVKRILETEIDLNESVGNILSKYIMPDGSIYEAPEGYSLLSIPTRVLKRMPNVIGIAFGKKKVQAISLAIRKGYVKTLITDQQTAQGLLEI